MVWVIKGQLNGKDEEDETVPLSTTSHYLRPSRVYRLGRRAYVPIPKPGSTHSVAIKARPYDFRIKSSTLAKGWSWEIKMGEWKLEDCLDRPLQPNNSSVYSFSYTAAKKPTKITRDGVEVELAAGATWEVKSGDLITFKKDVFFTAEWVPLVVYCSGLDVNQQKALLRSASYIGIKFAWKVEPDSTHTHFVVDQLEPTSNLFAAAINQQHITSMIWVQRLIDDCTVAPRPDDAPVRDEKETEEKFEERLAAFKNDVGADYVKYWGHSKLEDDWTAMHDPSDYLVIHPKYARSYEKERFIPDPARKEIFKGCLAMTFENKNLPLFTLAGGSHERCGLLDTKNKPDVEAIIKEIESMQLKHGGAATRLLLFHPADFDTDPRKITGTTATLKAKQKALGQVASHFQIYRYADLPAMTQAIYDADVDTLFPAPFAGELVDPIPIATIARVAHGPVAPSAAADVDQDMPEAGPSRHHQQLPAPSASSISSTLQSSVGSMLVVPGTHPIESTLRPIPPPSVVPAVAVEPKRKLTRRKPTAAASDAYGALSQAPAPELDPESASQFGPGGTMDLDLNSSNFGSTSTRRPLKRRAGTAVEETKKKNVSDADDDSEEEEEEADDRRRRVKKKPHLDEIDEEVEMEDVTATSAQAETGARATRRSTRSISRSPPPVKVSKTTKGKGKGRAKLNDVDEAEEESEEEHRLTKATTSKKKRGANEMELDEQVSPKKKARVASPLVASSPEPTPPTKSKAAATTKGKVKEKEKENGDGTLFQVKPIRRKGGEEAAQLAEEFNALKLVKPQFKPMIAKKAARLGWDEDDEEAEMMRLMREDMKERWDEENDAPQKGFFNIIYKPMGMKERPKRPQPDEATLARWALMPNFSKFKGKGARGPPAPPRKPYPLVLAPHPDFGIGPAYIYDKSRSKGKGTKSKPGVDEEDEDDDDFPTANKKRTGAAKSTGTQMKLGFAPVTTKAKPRAAAVKAKGKSKQIVEDTEDDEDEVDELAGGSEDEDFEMEMDGPSAHQPASKRASNSRVKATASQKSPAVKATKGKKAAMIDIVLSGSESDDGVTFRGFGAKKSTATQKKKK